MVSFKLKNGYEILFVQKYSKAQLVLDFYKRCKDGLIELIPLGNSNAIIPINLSEKEICYILSGADDYIFSQVYKWKMELTIDYTMFQYSISIKFRDTYAEDFREVFGGTLSEYLKTIDFINLYKQYNMDTDQYGKAKIDKAIDVVFAGFPDILSKDFNEIMKITIPGLMKELRGTANPALVTELIKNRKVYSGK